MKRVNLQVGLGETFTLALRYKDSTGTPVDLTGYTATCLVRDKAGDVIETITGTVDAEGNIAFKADTDDWPVGSNAYLASLTFPNTDDQWLAYGSLTVVSGLVV